MFGVPSPFVAGQLTPHVAALLDYAHNPLVLRTLNDDTDLGSVVSSQLFLHVNATLSLWNRLGLNVDVPFALYQAGGSPTAAGQRFPSPDKAQMGDLRLGARLRLLGEYDQPLQIGVGGYVWLPTAPSDGYVGDGKVRGTPQLLFGGRVADRVVWSLAGGPQFRAKQSFAGVTQGTEIHVGAGLGFLFLDNRHLQIGPEAYATFTVAKGDNSANDALKRATNLEVLADIRYRIVDDVEIGAGVGPGLTVGLGTPDFRGVFMLAYTPEMKKKPAPPVDRDGDGISDDRDACPDVKGLPDPDPKKNGCPADRDGDRILDEQDACPDEPGLPNEDPKKNGCPPPKDRDGDGIVDAEDACPEVKGVADADPKKNGCPPDTDGDGIIDPEDACPQEPGKPDPDPKKNGCPKVFVKEGKIEILEQVQFKTGSDVILPASDDLLERVTKVFADHTEITKVLVEGHTDNRGGKALNKGLSARRAASVKKWLVKHGVDAKRLDSQGFGDERPIGDNSTDEGRQQNRRVEFKILATSRPSEVSPGGAPAP